jgi:acyl dehydratase
MGKQVYYEDVEPGESIPTLVKHPLTRHLVMWAGANDEFQEIHYDKDFAQSKGLPGVVVQGDLLLSFLAQLLTDWVGDQGILKKINTRNRSMVFPNQDVICKGTVSKKYVENGENIVACEIWIEDNSKQKVIAGEAIVVLPTRNLHEGL